MPKQTNQKSGWAWKLNVRASANPEVTPQNRKVFKSDTSTKPAPGTRTSVWVGGYTRADGTKVEGYYRELGNTGAQ